MSTTVTAARLHLVTWEWIVAWPWAIMGSSLAINLLIFGLLGPQDRGAGHTGGLASIYVVVGIWAYQAMTQGFPFALGLSLTRRAFAGGTALVLTGLALLFGAALTVLRYVEGGTDGFGVGVHFFRLLGLSDASPLTQLLVFAVPFLLLGALGWSVAVVQHRWRQQGVFTLSILATLVLGAAAALIGWQHRWGALAGWFEDRPPLLSLVLLPLVATVAIGAAGFAALRRATA